MQYGLRIQGDEFKSMGWDEFADLLGGLNEQTPLVRLAQIRTESDPDRLKNFTREQRAERAKWQRKTALNKSQEDTSSFLEQLENTFGKIFGEQNGNN